MRPIRALRTSCDPTYLHNSTPGPNQNPVRELQGIPHSDFLAMASLESEDAARAKDRQGSPAFPQPQSPQQEVEIIEPLTVWDETMGANGWKFTDVPSWQHTKQGKKTKYAITCARFTGNAGKGEVWQSNTKKGLKHWRALGQPALYDEPPSEEVKLVRDSTQWFQEIRSYICKKKIDTAELC